ncbi:unnamed protein product [Boreogadus saida]
MSGEKRTFGHPKDHYLTVTAHSIYKGSIQQKVLSTEAVYESQTGPVVAEEIHSILEEFKLTGNVIAGTVDNASNMDVALKNLHFFESWVLCPHTQPGGTEGVRHPSCDRLVCKDWLSGGVAEALHYEQNGSKRSSDSSVNTIRIIINKS